MKIELSPPDLTQAEIDAVAEVLRSGWITTGPRTKQFEQALSEYCEADKTVCLNSATAALELTLRVLGVGSGDEVITSAYTYSASASVIEHVGAKIVLTDCAKDSYEMDYERLAEAITPKTKVIIPVDIAGVMCDYDRIFEIVESKRSLFTPNNDIQAAYGRVIVLADAAHSLGAVRKGNISGSVADFSAFSMHAVKNLTTAEGGSVSWRAQFGIDPDALYREYMLLSLHGQSKDALAKTKLGSWEYDIVYPAYKCNMTDIMAAIGLVQLSRYPSLLSRRRELCERYEANLSGAPVSVLHHFGSDFESSKHLMLVRLDGADGSRRNSVIEKMAQAGIPTNVHYKPLPMFTAYRRLGFDIADYPNAYAQFENELTLPLHTLLTDSQVDYICDTLCGIVK